MLAHKKPLRLLSAATAAILGTALLASCGGSGGGTTTGGGQTSTPTSAGGTSSETDEGTGSMTDEPSDSEGSDTSSEGSSEPTGTDDQVNNGEPVEVVYINWNLGTEEENNLERRMIQAYTDRYPNVTITIADYIDTTKYGESLNNAAASGQLPDVIMLPNIPFGLTNDWLLDLSELTADDAEWDMIAAPVLEAVAYGDALYAVPAGQFLAGMWVNKELFAEANVPQPTYGFTMDEMDEAIQAMTSPANATLGLEAEVDLINWIPHVLNPDLGWYTYDGEKFNLNSPEFIEGVNKARSYFENKNVYDALTEEERAGYEGANSYEVWIGGHTAMKYDGSWIAGGAADLPFTLEFIGLPGGTQVIIGDYIGINKDAENAEAAYHFAKFMTFSKTGQLERLRIAEENNLTWGSVPIINDQELVDAYFAQNTVLGLEEAFDNIDNSIVEGVKIVPGFVPARWEAETGIKIGDKDNATVGDLTFDAVRGNTRIEDYADQLNELANAAHQEAVDAIRADIG